jgi:hypothetical protein
MYLDANNLYGLALSAPLAIRGFKFLEKREIAAFPEKLADLGENDSLGYILEVDLDYPDELHDAHNDYPLAPVHFAVPNAKMAPRAKELLTKFGKKSTADCDEKLVPTLLGRERYVVHYLNLQFYLKKGMVLRKIHRILQFEQEAWLRPYISFNTEKRKNAKNAFEKDLYKLLNNSIFGKSLGMTYYIFTLIIIIYELNYIYIL